VALLWPEQEAAEALPLLRELLGRPELPFAEIVARALLAQSGDAAGEAVQRLSDPDPLVRQRIVLGVAHNVTKDERARHALVGALLDPDLNVRRAAATYCSRVIFLSWQDQAALAPLRQALGDADPQVRAGAANALRHLHRNASGAEPDLLALLRGDPAAEVRRSAGYSLATLEYETQAIFAGLEAGLDDPDEEVRRICAWGLCNWDSMTADRVRVLLRRLRRVDRGIGEFLDFPVCRAQVALPEVVAFLHDKLRKKVRRDLRSAAAVALGRLKVDDAAVLADLFALLDSGEEAGAEALCQVGPAALPGLIERLKQGSAEMREVLLRKAADLQKGNPHLADLLPGVLSCLRHEEEVRQAALRVMQGCKRRSAEGARLMEAMIWQERDRKTRRAAVVVLARISPNPRPVAATLAQVQKDRDAEVRAAVPDALTHLGLSPKVELDLLRVALSDAASGVRSAALWRAGSLGPAAAPLLPDLLRIVDGLDRGDWQRSLVSRALQAMGAVAAPALDALRAEDRAQER
jgi:HEAT repeat protein